MQSLQRPETLGTDGCLPFAVLDDSFDDQTGVAEDRGAAVGEELRVDDGLREAGLVLEREEDEAFRRAGTLPDDDGASGRDPGTVRDARQLDGGEDVVALQPRAEMLEEMRAGGDLRGLVIGEGFFDGGHLAQRM